MFRLAFFSRRALLALLLVTPAIATGAIPPQLSQDDISWVQIGTDVEFTLIFRNPDTVQSEAISGVLSSQAFGAFLENFGPICNFDVPPIPPGEIHTVVCTAPLSALPPSAEVILPASKTTTESENQLAAPCPGPNWFGNVDVMFGPGLQVNAHLAGNVPVCPGAGPTYIHIIVDNCPVGVTWNFANVCPNWTVTLASDMGGMPGPPAPNPLPPNPPPFDGWICIAADPSVPIGTVCCFDLLLNCGGQTATIRVWAEACVWGTVGVEQGTWGAVKSLYGSK